MARDISELGADVFDDTVDPKKSKMSTKKKNNIIGFSCLGVAVLALGAIYTLACTRWLVDLNNIEYLTVSYPIEDENADKEQIYATIERLDVQSDYPENFRIPQKIKGYPVKGIAEGAFRGADRLKSVDMSTIEYIGANAFAACTSLEDLKFSENIKSIGEDAFINTKYLSSLPADKPTVISDFLLHVDTENFFKENSVVLADRDSEIPEKYRDTSVYNICYFSDFSENEIHRLQNGIFMDSKNLVYFEFPSYVAALSNRIFDKCSKLEGVDMSKVSDNQIPSKAFHDCTSLQTINYREGLTSIGELAFSNSLITSPIGLETATYVGDGAYSLCRKITSVTYPDTLESVPSSLFKNCSSLAEFTFENPDKINAIGASAFEGTKLTLFRFPKNVNIINDRVFAGCSKLTSVELYANENEILVPGSADIDEDTGVCPNSYVDKLGNTKAGTPVGIRRINYEAFRDSESFNAVKLYGDDGNLISGLSEDNVFNFPWTLTNTNTSSTNPTGSYNFAKTSVGTVNINAGCSAISEYCFLDATNLSFVNFETYADNKSQLKTINKHAFERTNISTINIPDSVTSVGASAFQGCKKLTTVHLPETGNPDYPFTISDNLFRSCKLLSSVNIPSNTSKIASGAFSGVTGLTTIEIPLSCTTINEGAFSEMMPTDDEGEYVGTPVNVVLPWTEDEVNAGKYYPDSSDPNKFVELHFSEGWHDETVNVIYKSI